MHIIKDCSRGIIFQLPQNAIYRIVGTGKHAYYYVMLTNHVTSSNYMAEKPSNFYIFFLMQRIDYILTKIINHPDIISNYNIIVYIDQLHN